MMDTCSSTFSTREQIVTGNPTDLTQCNKKIESEEPFYFKEYHQANTTKEKIKSFLALFFLSMSFLGLFVFLIIFYLGSLKTRLFLVCISVLQNLITQRYDFYYDFIKNLFPAKYFRSFKIIIEEELDEKASLFPSVPHGIMTFVMSIAILNGHQSLRKIELLGTRAMIYMPLSGIFGRLMGIVGVNNSNFKRYMEEKRNIFFIPGGFECATLTNNNKDRVFLKNRKGFIKYALMYGYKIYPIYNYGENKLYYTVKYWPILDTIGLMLNKIKIPGVIFFGKYLIFPFCDVDVCCVIGKGIQLPKIDNPSEEDVSKYHNIYLEKLKELFNKYKSRYGSSEEIEIF